MTKNETCRYKAPPGVALETKTPNTPILIVMLL